MLTCSYNDAIMSTYSRNNVYCVHSVTLVLIHRFHDIRSWLTEFIVTVQSFHWLVLTLVWRTPSPWQHFLSCYANSSEWCNMKQNFKIEQHILFSFDVCMCLCWGRLFLVWSWNKCRIFPHSSQVFIYPSFYMMSLPLRTWPKIKQKMMKHYKRKIKCIM